MKNATSADQLKVVVVIPIYKDFKELSNNELRALLQVKQILARRDICLIHPPSIQIGPYSEMFLPLVVDTMLFESKYFGSCLRSNRLLLTDNLYCSFSNYEYILIHHIDSYVFSDQLDYWCDQKLDYIGAPWLQEISPSDDLEFLGVGNGGFSLRKVTSFREVIRRHRFVHLHSWLFLEGIIEALSAGKLAKRFNLTRLLNFMEYYVPNEDKFWGLIVPRYFKWFVVAKPQQALQFSFEVKPTRLFKLNNEELPFGCHAWERYDQAFWKPFIPFDESTPANSNGYDGGTLMSKS